MLVPTRQFDPVDVGSLEFWTKTPDSAAFTPRRITQLRCLFDQPPHRLPDIEAGEPERLAGNFVDAVTSMPCDIGTPA